MNTNQIEASVKATLSKQHGFSDAFSRINSPVLVNTESVIYRYSQDKFTKGQCFTPNCSTSCATENGKENNMQLSEKELSSINDLLSEEELLTKKFKMLAEQTTDTELKDKFTNISEKHQQHFNSLYKLLG